MRVIHLLILLLALPYTSTFFSTAFAQTWGPASPVEPGFNRNVELENIFKQLAKAPDEVTARVIADRLWTTWMMTPDAETAEDMNRALRARGGYNFDKALGILNVMIARHPEYAESWNQRSYIHFLKKDYTKSLADCEHALMLEPRHIGCMAGMARIKIRHQKRFAAGKALLEKAIELNPFIYERVLLKEIPTQEL